MDKLIKKKEYIKKISMIYILLSLLSLIILFHLCII